MTWLFALSLAVCSPSQSESGDLYRQIVQRPDPRNGYEDYLRATALVNGPSGQALRFIYLPGKLWRHSCSNWGKDSSRESVRSCTVTGSSSTS
jgi:hypothetical protein